MAGGEDKTLFAHLYGRGKCKAADRSARWHITVGAFTSVSWLHLVWSKCAKLCTVAFPARFSVFAHHTVCSGWLIELVEQTEVQISLEHSHQSSARCSQK